MQSDLVRSIARDIDRQGMLHAGERVGVGVSGGADSVALLRILEELASELGLRLAVLHFNHQLRGAESDADEQFVIQLAAERGLPFLVGRDDVAGVARDRGWNLEDAGRRLRTAYFSSMVAEGAVARVAVAHTADDQAETVLARLVRGTGPAGLAAIYPVNGPVIRPLLAVRRRELREYLQNLGQVWREDASNQDTQRLRARLRHQILPLLERDLQPSIVRHLGQLAQMAREDEAFWTALVSERLAKLTRREPGSRFGLRLAIRCADLLSPLALAGRASDDAAGFALTRRIVRGLVEQLRGDCRDLTAKHVQQVLRLARSGSSGQRSDLPGVTVERSFEWLLFHVAIGRVANAARAQAPAASAESDGSDQSDRSSESASPLRTELGLADGEYSHAVQLGNAGDATIVVVPEIGRRFQLKMIDCFGGQGENYSREGALDRDSLRSPLVLRNWRHGDSYRPQGSRGVRKLKQFLRVRRVPLQDRAGWPVLTSGGALVWARGCPAAADSAAQERTRVAVVIAEEAI